MYSHQKQMAHLLLWYMYVLVCRIKLLQYYGDGHNLMITVYSNPFHQMPCIVAAALFTLLTVILSAKTQCRMSAQNYVSSPHLAQTKGTQSYTKAPSHHLERY